MLSYITNTMEHVSLNKVAKMQLKWTTISKNDLSFNVMRLKIKKLNIARRPKKNDTKKTWTFVI